MIRLSQNCCLTELLFNGLPGATVCTKGEDTTGPPARSAEREGQACCESRAAGDAVMVFDVSEHFAVVFFKTGARDVCVRACVAKKTTRVDN